VDPTTKEVQYLAGESISISVSASFKESALSDNSVVSGQKLVIDSGLTFVGTSPRNEFRNFSVSGYYGNGVNQSFYSSTSETTFTNAPTSINANFYYSATAVTDVTIKVESTFTIGDYTYEADDFSFYNVYASTGNFMPGSKQNEPVLGRSIDSAIGFSTINACVNATGLTAGDILEANFDVNDGTSQVGEKDYRWFVRNSQGMPQGEGGMDETFEVPVIADGYKLTFGVDVQISPVVDGKTYTFAEYKVVKQGSTANLLTHCKETLATGTLRVSGSAVTGTLDSTPDGGGGMPSMGSFDSYSCALYAIADTGFVTPVKTASAYLFGQFGPVTNPTCTIGNVASGTYKMGIRGISYSGIGSEKILSGSVTVGGAVTPPAGGGTTTTTPAPKAKVTQKVPAIAKTVKVKKTISFKKTTNAKLLMVVKNSTPKICKVAVKGANFTVTGLKPGNCKITLSQKGSATANPLKATVKTIKVVK
jgi:hypothetical protein